MYNMPLIKILISKTKAINNKIIYVQYLELQQSALNIETIMCTSNDDETFFAEKIAATLLKQNCYQTRVVLLYKLLFFTCTCTLYVALSDIHCDGPKCYIKIH